MHRSGTSTLAGTLGAAGVYFGDVLDQKIPTNPKGLQEAPAILFMQEDLLEKNGGSWHTPPDKVIWTQLHKSVRDLFIESRTAVELWAFKDPRTLLTLQGWLEALPELECVGIFRHPAEVAVSIHRRNKFELKKCFEIWLFYNERLLQYAEQRSIPIVEFVSHPETMHQSFATLLSRLDLEFTSRSVDFFDSQFKHIELPSVEIPERTLRLYRQLQFLAI